MSHMLSYEEILLFWSGTRPPNFLSFPPNICLCLCVCIWDRQSHANFFPDQLVVVFYYYYHSINSSSVVIDWVGGKLGTTLLHGKCISPIRQSIISASTLSPLQLSNPPIRSMQSNCSNRWGDELMREIRRETSNLDKRKRESIYSLAQYFNSQSGLNRRPLCLVLTRWWWLWWWLPWNLFL